MQKTNDVEWYWISLLYATLGMVGGMVSAWLVWNFFYSIGESVISDEVHAYYSDDVSSWGAIAGAISGFALGVLPQFQPIAALALLHTLSVMAGAFTGASTDWKNGLVAFFAPHVVAMAGCGLYALVLATKGHRGLPRGTS